VVEFVCKNSADHILPDLEDLMPKAQLNYNIQGEEVDEVEAQEEPVVQRIVELPQVGRNDPCPCGSGEKYKNCHMKQGNPRRRSSQNANP
jgi:preprotein translocase subunit SecA